MWILFYTFYLASLEKVFNIIKYINYKLNHRNNVLKNLNSKI